MSVPTYPMYFHFILCEIASRFGAFGSTSLEPLA